MKMRINKFKIAVFNCLIGMRSLKLPLDMNKICEHHNVKLYTYSEGMRDLKYSYEEMCGFGGTRDAFVLSKAHNNKMYYQIYYNDLEPEIMKSKRYIFNIAHELGHIFLGHLKNNCTTLSRGGISYQLYKKYEDEADKFAAFLLSPHIILYHLEVKTPWELRGICRISEQASTYRFKEYRQWAKRNKPPFHEHYDRFLASKYLDFISKYTCETCGNKISVKHGFCEVCGNANPATLYESKVIAKLIERMYTYMYYKDYEVNGEKQLYECLECENENIFQGEKFCHICGTPVVNKCSAHGDLDNSNGWNKEYYCDTLLPANARFCTECGRESLFFTRGLLKSWKEEKEEMSVIINIADIPF